MTCLSVGSQAEQSAAQAGYFAEIIHDVRQGVHAIGLHMDSLTQLHLAPTCQSHEHTIAAIEQSLAWMNALLSNAFDLSCVDAGTLRAVCAPVEVAPLMQAVIIQHAAVAERAGVRVVALVGEGRSVRADEHMLRRVMANLLDNAIKFSSRGSTVALVLRFGAQDRWLLQVRDAGKGFAPLVQHALFCADVRLSTATGEHGKGTGLGLSLARRLVVLMEGTLLAHAARGRGTVMTVSLPRADPAFAGQRGVTT